MCGILGIYNSANIGVDRDRFNSALQKIAHRGPDHQGTVFLNENRVALGHTRLSIIDLSESANQPMTIDGYTLVYNGEVYNYKELRSELLQLGVDFVTNSDTEVVLKSYMHWGEDCVKKFNGMWAFAIYEQGSQRIFCSRDRYGIKPFYYYYDNKRFIFSSEAKSIITIDENLKVPNYNSISLFCREGVCGEIADTWFMGMKRLQPGHNLIYSGVTPSIIKYYNYIK